MDVKTKENFSSLGKKSQEQDGKEISKLSQDLLIRLKLNHPLNDFHVGRLFFCFCFVFVSNFIGRYFPWEHISGYK